MANRAGGFFSLWKSAKNLPRFRDALVAGEIFKLHLRCWFGKMRSQSPMKIKPSRNHFKRLAATMSCCLALASVRLSAADHADWSDRMQQIGRASGRERV